VGWLNSLALSFIVMAEARLLSKRRVHATVRDDEQSR
jgi:hypothetical protein